MKKRKWSYFIDFCPIGRDIAISFISWNCEKNKQFRKKIKALWKITFLTPHGFLMIFESITSTRKPTRKKSDQKREGLNFFTKKLFFLQKLEIFLEGQKMTLKYFCTIPKHSNIKIKEQKDTNKLLVVIFWEF